MATTDSSVLSIVSAFTRSLDIFKDLREKRRKKKRTKRVRGASRDENGDELRLSKSLRQGPVDVQREYERHYRSNGDRYAIGDSIAQSSLARTIRKLNTGLVNFISSFLSCDRKDAEIDYKFLTSLSDTSRQEALDTLSQLSYRMSRSAMSLNAQPTPHHDRPRHGNDRDGNKNGSTKSRSRDDTRHTPKEKKRDASKERDGKKPTVRRVQLSNSSTSTLAIVRPRTRRTGSSTSSSSRSQSTPPPAYSGPPSPQSLPSPHSPPPDIQVPYQSPYQQTYLIPQNHTPHPPPPSPPQKPDPYLERTYRRRQDKTTPSMYTFASDSTKLGEIPMRRWNIPHDHEAMAKKNVEVPLRPWTSEEPVQRPKRGFFGMFRKSGATATVA